MVDIGGTLTECDVYQIVSKAGQEKLWVLLDGPQAGAPVKVESPAGNFLARKVEPETLTLGAKTFECARMSGEETTGGKTVEATRWWSLAYPLGWIKSVGPSGQVESVKAGDDWTKRPPFPS